MPFHSLNGLNLFYETYGQGETALLFIHGLYGDSNSWKYQIDYFSNKYKIVTIDMFGHGLSSKDVDPIMVPRLSAEVVVDLMKTIGLPYFVIGHSFAGNVMPEMIKLDSSKLKGAVFVDCTYLGDWEILKTRVKFGKSMLTLSDEKIGNEAEYWYNSLIVKSASQEDRDFILSSFRKGDHRWMFQSVAGCDQFIKQYPIKETPIRDHQPIFIMESGSGIGINFRKSWVNYFKLAEYYLFENAGHFFFITDHERFNKILSGFLEENI